MLNTHQIDVMQSFVQAIRDVEKETNEDFNLDFTIDIYNKTFTKKETSKLFMIYLRGVIDYTNKLKGN